ncbi:Glutathione s-transferase u8 [Thalictrum thalictroides]|uniref:Glutathione S-transferase n=1 Tax=Thalictrum thalictroides TaxID=46969 RepID=A0A7J6VYL9_THATH|nr:Glutathione s-transferase u8 [Thalictrum thalictroides]
MLILMISISMENKEVKLLGLWSSPFPVRVIWALKLKGIEYEYIEEKDLMQNKSPLLLQSNPVLKKVPVLIHGGKPICESLNILEYIDEVWSHNRLLPEDPYEKAVVRFWAKFAEEKLVESARTMLTSEGEELEKEVKQLEEALDILEKEMKDLKKKFFGGESIGYLDLVLAWSVLWLEIIEELSCGKKISDTHRYPTFNRWMEDVKNINIIKENLPSKDQLTVYLLYVRNLALASKANN